MLARGSGKVLELPSNGDSLSIICFASCCLLPRTVTFQENSQCLLNGSMEVEKKKSNIFNSSTVYFGMQHTAFCTGMCVFCGVDWTEIKHLQH